MESNVVSGVAYSRDEAKMTLVSVADRPGIAAAIFVPLSEAGINVDMICLLYTSPSPRDRQKSRMPSSA